MKVFGQFMVNEDGDIIFDNSDKNPFMISSDRLKEADWLMLLKNIPNFNWSDFMDAYYFAADKAGINRVVWYLFPKN